MRLCSVYEFKQIELFDVRWIFLSLVKMRVFLRLQLLSLAAIIFASRANVILCAWTQNLSLPLSEKPTDLVEVIYSM